MYLAFDFVGPQYGDNPMSMEIDFDETVGEDNFERVLLTINFEFRSVLQLSSGYV